MSEQLYQIQEPEYKKQQENIAVGIDLGTTNSLVAFVENGKVKLLQDENEHILQPSLVNIISSQGKPLVVKSVKRLMGKNYQQAKDSKLHQNLEIVEENGRAKIVSFNKKQTAEELSAVILANLKSIFKAQENQDLSQAVITVPAFFSDVERQATKKAAEIAGIKVLRLINEPTAALLAYGLENNTKGNYVVYDLGGGTFDVSVLKLVEGVFQVKSTLGDIELGGDDFDLAIAEFLGCDYAIAKQLKHQLTSQNKAEVEGFNLTDEQFYKLTQPLLQKTVEILTKAIADSKLDDIDGVVLVGGSTKMPVVKKVLEKHFNYKIYNDLDPETIVAKGAAIQADKLLNKNRDVLLVDVNPISLGIETMGGLFERIIERNAPIPTAKAQKFTTFKDGQTSLAINVYQGERELVADCKLLGKLVLTGIPAMNAGMARIKVSFILDENSILQVQAFEEQTGIQQQIKIESQLSDLDSLNMLKDAISHGKQDIEQREFIKSKVELQQVIQASYNLINNEEISTDEKANMLAFVKMAENKLPNIDKKEVLDQTRLDLEDYFKQIVKNNMNKLLAENLVGKSLDEV